MVFEPSVPSAAAESATEEAAGVGAGRRSVLLAIALLAVIAIGFVTPPIFLGHALPRGVHAMSPLEDGWGMFWLVYLGAAALIAIGGIAAALRTPPGRLATVLTYAVIASALFVPLQFLGYTFTEGGSVGSFGAVFVAEIGGALVLCVLATRARGYRRWLRLVGAFAILVAHFGCPRIAGMVNEFSGGITFVAAEIGLLIVVARA